MPKVHFRGGAEKWFFSLFSEKWRFEVKKSLFADEFEAIFEKNVKKWSCIGTEGVTFVPKKVKTSKGDPPCVFFPGISRKSAGRPISFCEFWENLVKKVKKPEGISLITGSIGSLSSLSTKKRSLPKLGGKLLAENPQEIAFPLFGGPPVLNSNPLSGVCVSHPARRAKSHLVRLSRDAGRRPTPSKSSLPMGTRKWPFRRA